MRKYCNWDKEDEQFAAVVDVAFVFLECLQDQVKKEIGEKGRGRRKSMEHCVCSIHTLHFVF